MGLLKMDFLGLTTLTVIDDALKLIKLTKASTSISRRSRWTTRTTYEQVFPSRAHFRAYSV